jgi:hypothetical protein
MSAPSSWEQNGNVSITLFASGQAAAGTYKPTVPVASRRFLSHTRIVAPGVSSYGTWIQNGGMSITIPISSSGINYVIGRASGAGAWW